MPYDAAWGPGGGTAPRTLALPADGMEARGGESHEGLAAPAAEGGAPKDGDAPTMGLAEAVREAIGIIRDPPPSGSEGADGWERIVRTVAENDSLPDGQIKVIEKAVAEAYGGWSDVQRRSIWYEADSGMTDDDDDDAPCDTSFNGIGYALQVEMLDEVTHAGWRDASDLKEVAAKRPAAAARRAVSASQGTLRTGPGMLQRKGWHCWRYGGRSTAARCRDPLSMMH